MPAYLITHTNARRGDTLAEDPALTLAIRDGWAVLTDDAGICLAIPTEHVASIQRIDADPEQQDTEPEPRE